MKKFIVSLVLSLVAIFTIASTAGACTWWFYQPELPQKPQKQ
jgi:cyclic lactone autoinducer peptide